jgi:TonB family protein
MKRKALPLGILALITLGELSLPEAHAATIKKPAINNKTVDSKAPSNKPKAGPVTIRDKWAVLIGINHGQDQTLPVNKYATRNVLTLMRTLCAPNAGRYLPDHVLVVAEGKATKENLAKTLYEDWLPHKALPNDLVLLYFCGNLLTTDNKDDLLLMPFDGQKAAKENSGLSLSGTLKEIQRRLQCKNIIFCLDTSLEGEPGTRELLERIQKDSQVTILACDAGLAHSAVDPMAMTSYFASSLSEGLKAGAGLLDLDTVVSYVAQTVKQNQAAQEVKLLTSPENQAVTKLVIGQPIKQPYSPANIKIGYSIEKLEQTRPDLALEAKRMQEKMADTKPLNKKAAADEEDTDEDDEQEDVDFGPYMQGMKSSIQAKWQSPRLAKGKNVIAMFSIERNGQITEPRIVESSGSQEIDDSALKALKDASPLAPLPKGSPRHVEIRYKFEWKVENASK